MGIFSAAESGARVLSGRSNLGRRGRYLSILEPDRSEEHSHRSIGALAKTAVLGLHSSRIALGRIRRLGLASPGEFTALGNLGKSCMSTRFPPADRNLLGTMAGKTEPGRARSGQPVSQKDSGNALDSHSAHQHLCIHPARVGDPHSELTPKWDFFPSSAFSAWHLSVSLR